MKEKERLIIIDQINKDIEEKESLPKKEKELQELLKNEHVKRYLEIKKQIENLNNSIFNKSNEDIVRLRFVRAMIGTDKYEGVNPCKHNIWFYENSIKCIADLRGEHDAYLPCNNETDPNFEYNVYICLDCQKQKEIKNWREFESTNFVLKNYDDKQVFEYINRYYQLLYEMGADDAEEIIIKEFNDNLEKSKQKKLNI